MGTTAQKLQAIQSSKAAIKAAIEAKGVSDVGDVLADYATKIGEISGGGGSTKFGMTIDSLVGDANSSGQLQLPSTPFSFSSTEIKSLADYALFYKFYNNTGLTSVNLPNLTSCGTSGFQYAFTGCTNLTSVNLPNLTSCGTSGFQYAFTGCTNLTSVNLPKLASGTLNSTFRGCTSLTSVELPEFNGSIPSTFFGCSNLVSFSAPKMATGSLPSAFTNCTRLQTVDLSGLTTSSLSNAFSGLTALRTVKLNHYRGTLSNTFQNCSNLEVVDFHETTAVPTLSNTTTFSGTNNTYRILVPNALYDQWIAASNWSYSSIVTHIEKFLRVVGFKAESANSTISLDAVGTPTSIDIEYSTDGGATFSPYTVGTTITLTSVDDTVMFRAGSTGQTALADDSSNYHKFTMTGSISIEDDISYLLSRSGVPSTTTLADYAFYGLFNGCSALQNAPELPWTTMGEGCYGHMFEGCTALTEAPTLPATTLATGCYNEMFYGCSSLNSITISYTGNFSTTYFNDWVYGVAASGTFKYKGSDTTVGTSAIPSGWTIPTIHYMNYINTNVAEMNTGVVPTTTTKVVGRFRGSAVGNWFVGIEGQGWRGFNSTNTFYVDLNGMSARISQSGWDTTKWYDVEYGNFYFTCTPVDGGTTISQTSTARSFTHSNPLKLGSATYQWVGEYEQFDCAGFKIYDGTTLVKDYRPAVDENNVACFYEEVSGTFAYPSSGTFLAY